MKLRYFWKTINGPKDALTFKLLTYRKTRLLDFSKGFAQDIFNICINYNAMISGTDWLQPVFIDYLTPHTI